MENPFANKPPLTMPTLEAPKESDKPVVPKSDETVNRTGTTTEEVVNVIKKHRGKVIKSPTVNTTPGLTKKAQVLAAYNYVESDIPVNHPYWQMKD